jgi:hypothetical protein
MTNEHGFEVTPEYIENLLYHAFFAGYQSAPEVAEYYPFTPGTGDDPKAKGFRIVSDEMRSKAQRNAKLMVGAIQDLRPELPIDPECSWCGEEDCDESH